MILFYSIINLYNQSLTIPRYNRVAVSCLVTFLLVDQTLLTQKWRRSS